MNWTPLGIPPNAGIDKIDYDPSSGLIVALASIPRSPDSAVYTKRESGPYERLLFGDDDDTLVIKEFLASPDSRRMYFLALRLHQDGVGLNPAGLYSLTCASMVLERVIEPGNLPCDVPASAWIDSLLHVDSADDSLLVRMRYIPYDLPPQGSGSFIARVQLGSRPPIVTRLVELAGVWA